jgi:hypothetical protein
MRSSGLGFFPARFVPMRSDDRWASRWIRSALRSYLRKTHWETVRGRDGVRTSCYFSFVVTTLVAVSEASGSDTTAVILAVLGGLLALYGAGLSTKNYLWQRRRREAERQRSDVEVDWSESGGLGDGDLIIGTTIPMQHHLTVRVINRGELPEYVYEVALRSAKPSPFAVSVRKSEGSVEVRPRDHEEFTLPLDGRQHFEWHEPFVVVVRLANAQEFRSPPATLRYPPFHGTPYTVPDLDEVPDGEIYRIRPEDLAQD